MSFLAIFYCDVLLQNIEEVKRELEQHLLEHPYDWYHLTSLENALCKKAEFVYNGSGYELAVQKIDALMVSKAFLAMISSLGSSTMQRTGIR